MLAIQICDANCAKSVLPTMLAIQLQVCVVFGYSYQLVLAWLLHNLVSSIVLYGCAAARLSPGPLLVVVQGTLPTSSSHSRTCGAHGRANTGAGAHFLHQPSGLLAGKYHVVMCAVGTVVLQAAPNATHWRHTL